MKRIISLLILAYVAAFSLVLPILTIESFRISKKDVITPTSLVDITYKLDVKKIDNKSEEQSEPPEAAIQSMQTEMAEIESIMDKKEWFLAYKDIVFKYSKWLDPPETVFDYYTENEVRLICKVVETECFDQSFEAKTNVASVLFNRIEHDSFGDSVEDIITKENQFVYGRNAITEDTILAVMYAWEIEDITDGCIAFRSDENPPDIWHGWSRVFQDDSGHWFYK